MSPVWKLTYSCVVPMSVSLPAFERQERKGDGKSVDRRLYEDSGPCEILIDYHVFAVAGRLPTANMYGSEVLKQCEFLMS